MRTTTIKFDMVKGSARYLVTCASCGKLLNRTVTIEQSVNPFNKNAAGSPKTYAEVSASARAAAVMEAKRLTHEPAACRDCEDAPNRTLLLEMAAEPERVFAEPARFWNSPMHVLEERKQVERVHIRCTCGSDCCSGYKRSPGFKITKAGRQRATTLSEGVRAA
jgi:hypothetical protein